MSERSGDIEARIGTVHQLSVVITAMRGIAAARSREARGRLDGIRAHAAIIANAIGHALVFLPSTSRGEATVQATGGHVVVALCAEQGFAGVFNERVLDAAASLATAPNRRTELFVLGDRGLMVAQQRGLAVTWSAAMIAHVDEAVPLANRVVEALYERLEDGRATHVTVIHAAPDPSAALHIVEKRLVPFDYDRFPPSASSVQPLLTLPPQVLLARLAEEYIFSEMCEAVVVSFAAENEARMRAMIAAKTNVAKTLEDLVASSRRLRQEEITNEIIELASGGQASI